MVGSSPDCSTFFTVPILEQYRCHKLRWFQHKQLLEENDLGGAEVYRFWQRSLAFSNTATRTQRVLGHKATRDGLGARFVALGSLRCEPLVRDITRQVQHAAEVVLQSTGQADPPPADCTVSVLQCPDDMGGDRLATHEAVHGESAVFALVFMIRFGILWQMAEMSVQIVFPGAGNADLSPPIRTARTLQSSDDVYHRHAATYEAFHSLEYVGLGKPAVS